MIDIVIQDWVYNLLLLIYVVTIIGTIIVVVSENRNPLKSIAWIVVLVFFPAVGLVSYFFFGRDFRRQRMISKKSLKKITKYAEHVTPDLNNMPVGTAQEIQLLYNLTQTKLYKKNSIHIFTFGKLFFDDLIEKISQAKHFIHIQFYIIQDDELGSIFKDLLIKKASEGVEVRVIYDDVGSWRSKNSFFNEMKSHGVQISAFLEVKFAALANKINYRNHRKMVIIDGVYGYIGGMNIANRYLNGLETGVWRDTHIRIEGCGVKGIQTSFSIDWYFQQRELLWDSKYFPSIMADDDVDLQIITSGPIGEWRQIHLAVFKAISNAKRYVYIQTPYFLPTESLMTAMQTAALSNVDVRIMIPERSDSKIVHIGTLSYIQSVLDAGVKVYMYKPGFLHAKMIVIDDEMCSVGSTNMDFRSFEHNFEANAFIYSEKVTKEMKKIFLYDQKDCKRVIKRTWRNRPIKQKSMESIIRLLSPLL